MMSAVVVVGFGLGFVGLVWFAIDSSRIPSVVWYWSGHSRAAWYTAAVACLLAVGFPALILAVVWRFGEARRSLNNEVRELRNRGRSVGVYSSGSVA